MDFTVRTHNYGGVAEKSLEAMARVHLIISLCSLLLCDIDAKGVTLPFCIFAPSVPCILN